MKRQKNATKYSRVLDCEMDRFSATLKKRDAEQATAERKELSFKQRKYSEEQRRYHQMRQNFIADNELKRAEQKQEREDCDRLEQHKFKLMMKVIQKKVGQFSL